jgi:hypothetical protein
MKFHTSKITDADKREMLDLERAAETVRQRGPDNDPFAAGRRFSEASRVRDAAYRFTLRTDLVMHGDACIGAITYVSDTNSPHKINTSETTSYAIAGVVSAQSETTAALDELRSLDELRLMFGATGEAQHYREMTPHTLTLLRALRGVSVPAETLKSWKSCMYAAAWHKPNMRTQLELVAAELDRLSRTMVSGRGHVTLAAQRVIDGADANMVFGAMQR